MNITTELLGIVEQAHAPAQILQATVSVIREWFRADTCVAFLFDDTGQLMLKATSHSSAQHGGEHEFQPFFALATQVARTKRTALAHSEQDEMLASPLLFRDAPMGALVIRGADRPEFSTADSEELAKICAQFVDILENARIIDALDRGELPPPRQAARPPTGEPKGECTLQGVAASPGIAIGCAAFRIAQSVDLAAGRVPAGDLELERARARAAIEKTRNDVVRVQAAAAREIDEDHALIFASHLLLLNDPLLLARIDQQITTGSNAVVAIDGALREFEARLLLVPDAYMQEKAEDVDDLRARLMGHLLDNDGRARFGERIVVSRRVPPSLVIELKTEGAQALVTETGGATSHGILLARALRIPAVTGVLHMLSSLQPGDPLLVDGTKGIVIVRPSEATLTRYRAERMQAERTRTEHAKYRHVLATTSDGVRIPLYANVGVASDIRLARENGAEGIGLYRTEFPFILRDSFPTLTEQVGIYRKAYEAFPDAPIYFRILDLGGDKFGGGPISGARNAFHGYRSIRVLFDHPDVLSDQIYAFALAAAHRPLRILIPMLTSIEDLRRVKAIIADALTRPGAEPVQRAPEIGAMIEVPAAVELCRDIAREVDFLSIGTNDLMQYALVVDREDSRMAALSDPYHPAILRMLARIAAAAREAGKPVSVCGEIAARPDFAVALIALGIDALSVVPSAIPGLKQALAAARLEPIRREMPRILALSESSAIANALRCSECMS